MNKKKPGRIPGFIVRLAIGKDLYEVISMNCKVTNEKAKKILGWKPQYPSYKEGLAAAISEMKQTLLFLKAHKSTDIVMFSES